MKIFNIFNTIITENTISQNMKAFYDKFITKNPNPDFLKNSFRNPDFELRMVSDGGVKKFDNYGGAPNKCETNVFNFIKSSIDRGEDHYYPVSGWAFLESTTFFEHFWIYDDVNDLFLEITPVGNDIVAYGGVVNKEINGDIEAAEKFYDIPFLKGKAASSLYINHKDNEPNIRLNGYKEKFNSKDEAIFDYINRSPKYAELKDYLSSTRVDSIKDLLSLIPKFERAKDATKNNREWMGLNKIITQIYQIQRL